MAYLGYDPVVCRLYEEGVDVLNQAERDYVFVLLFDDEICNGGFQQLLHNHDVFDTDQMLQGLDSLKMRDCCALLRLAIKAVGEEGRQEDWQARQEYLTTYRSSYQGALDRLDKSYYDRYKWEDIVNILKRHVIAHRDEFLHYGEEFASGAWD